MTAARALWTWVAVCAAGAGLVLLASGRDWFTVTYGARAVPVAAADVAPALGPAAWASLAAVVAVLATRGVWRRIVGGVMAVCGAGAVVAAWAGSRPAAAAAVAAEQATGAAGQTGGLVAAVPAWPVVAGVGGLVLLAGGVVAAVKGGAWPGMSDRYERSGGAGRAAARGTGERALWDAIDRGADPTVDPETPDDPEAPGRPDGPGTPRPS
ncbi:Trp biosynthesis-associated membrane protein [Streptosporangium sandarakinum]|uniref:Trp biosynthesis-associated membrane protein n=1 Tax=Streptosporangium TaxID=2000 RepID=UPI0031F81992